MGSSAEALFSLLSVSLGGSQELLVLPVNWAEVMELAIWQNVVAFAFDAFDSLPADQRPETDSLMEWLGQTSYVENTYDDQWKAAKAFGCVCHENGYRPFVMKGFSLSCLYPKPSHRSGTDLDSFCIDGEGYCCCPQVDNLVEQSGVIVDRSYYKNSKFTFQGLTIENHQHVLPVRGSRNAKALEQWLLDGLVPATPVYLNGSFLESPSAIFMAVHVLAHAQEHFFEEGINLRHVCDWAMILKNYSDAALWAEWRDACERFGLLKFGYALSRLARLVCGVEIPFECPQESLADKRLLDSILDRKHGESKSGNARRVELVLNIFRDRWKFKYFSDTNAFSFALRRIYGYLFE